MNDYGSSLTLRVITMKHCCYQAFDDDILNIGLYIFPAVDSELFNKSKLFCDSYVDYEGCQLFIQDSITVRGYEV